MAIPRKNIEVILMPDGLRGLPGKNAYELAVSEGFEGTLDEWLESIIGPEGNNAYDLAVEEGFEGTLEEWLGSLRGPKGDQGERGPQGPGLSDEEAQEVLDEVDTLKDMVIGIGSGEGGKAYDSLADALAADIPDNVVFQTPEGIWRRDSSLPSGAEFIRAFPATEQQIADIGQSVDDLHNQVDVELAGIRSDNAAFQSNVNTTVNNFQSAVNNDLQQITAEKQVFESEAQDIKDALANMTTTGKIYDSIADAIAESPKPADGTPFSVMGDGDNDGYWKFDSNEPDGVKWGREFDKNIVPVFSNDLSDI